MAYLSFQSGRISELFYDPLSCGSLFLLFQLCIPRLQRLRPACQRLNDLFTACSMTELACYADLCPHVVDYYLGNVGDWTIQRFWCADSMLCKPHQVHDHPDFLIGKICTLDYRVHILVL